MERKYWRALDESEAKTEESSSGFADFSRRDFLMTAGFSVAAVAVAGCQRAPIDKVIPYLNAPENIVPGRAYWLASTCHGCPAACGVLVKCRDGRPIKLEGNPEHPISKGGLCAVGQATVLELYDSTRLGGPLAGGKAAQWRSVDAAIETKLRDAKRVRVVSSTLASPTASAVIGKFLDRFEDGKHVVYDALSSSAILDAHEQTHGLRVLPRYRFDRADVIVSFDADFLGTWISPVEFTRGWSERRSATPSMSWHAQLEPRMSLTGSNADQRLRILPGEIGAILSYLLGDTTNAPVNPIVLDRIAQRLRDAHGRSLVVCGSASVADQIAVNRLNQTLGNYGTALDLGAPSYQRQGSERDLALLVEELRRETVDALFVLSCNPVYDLANGHEVATLLKGVPLVVSFAERVDETASHAHFVCPDHHFLESWRDSEPVAGLFAVTQPAIAPLGETRSCLESFSAWSGTAASAYDLIRQERRALDWDKTLNDGFAVTGAAPLVSPSFVSGPKPAAILAGAPAPGHFALVLYPKPAMLDGRHAHNPWLHELPDPISKVTWDNYAAISPDTAGQLGIKDGDVVRVTASNGASVELPAFAQPGQHDRVVAIALGYGRLGTDRFGRLGPKWLLRRTLLNPGEPVGRRAVQLTGDVMIAKSGAFRPVASTQLHNTMSLPPELAGKGLTRPPVVEETTLAAFVKNPHAGAGEEHHEPADASLWSEHARGPHQWAMAIDLTRCTGCSACVIACQAENNVPVVGKDEVLREREMHWMRIDRYYSGASGDVDVVHQPMLCHHCGNAPCESVCPVLATVHSSEGLNQQIYNRCVGTRYCENNCPYKTRRFNWFDYPHDDRLQNMVLNPDVTVRSRGVMEKCSMCVQRIEDAKIEARRLGIAVADGAVQTACQQSCPAVAIVFGDLNDRKSRIAAARLDPRHYMLLEELNVKPSVGYFRLVRNRDEESIGV